MASSSRYHLTLLTFIFSISIVISHANQQFTSIFSFGDSLADTGNLLQLSRLDSHSSKHGAEFPPYGRTFFHHPNGRCSDGRLVIDFIAAGVGLPFLPPYFGESKNFEKGVNFAVAGATALDNTFLEERGISCPTNVSLNVQLGLFKHVLPSLCSSSSDCKAFLENSLIVVGEIGGNDYNHPLLKGKDIEEIQELVPLVVQTIGSTIKELIELGAVTFLVPGNFPIGCSTAYLTHFNGSPKEEYDSIGCIKWLNQFSEYHNELLLEQLDQIRNSYPHVDIFYADYYNIAMRFFRSPNQFGFKQTQIACCGGGGPYNYSSSMLCGDPLVRSSCDDPSSYVNWDGLHLTEAAYRWISQLLLQQLFTIDPSLIQIELLTRAGNIPMAFGQVISK